MSMIAVLACIVTICASASSDNDDLSLLQLRAEEVQDRASVEFRANTSGSNDNCGDITNGANSAGGDQGGSGPCCWWFAHSGRDHCTECPPGGNEFVWAWVCGTSRRCVNKCQPNPTPNPTPDPTPDPTPNPTPDPTPNPTPYPLPCNGIAINQFAGEKLSVEQTSTLYGRNTYTYDVEIGVGINQKTSDAGDYFLGSHDSYGDMSESFRNGEKCGSKPRRADVTYTLGSHLRLVEAKETSTCVYEFVIQLPESKCNLPLTPLDDLDTDDEDHVDEREEEEQAEEKGEHNCAKWCSSKKHAGKAWKGPVKPFKCGWFQCSDCDECL